jgi:hypothetical protein
MGAGTGLTSRLSRKSSNNSRDTFRCQTDAFKFIPRRPHANVAATPRPYFFDVNGLCLIYEPYGYKSPRRASGARLSRDKARRVFCSLPTCTVNLASGTDANLFNLFSWKRSTLRERSVKSVEPTVAREEPKRPIIAPFGTLPY